VGVDATSVCGFAAGSSSSPTESHLARRRASSLALTSSADFLAGDCAELPPELFPVFRGGEREATGEGTDPHVFLAGGVVVVVGFKEEFDEDVDGDNERGLKEEENEEEEEEEEEGGELELDDGFVCKLGDGRVPVVFLLSLSFLFHSGSCCCCCCCFCLYFNSISFLFLAIISSSVSPARNARSALPLGANEGRTIAIGCVPDFLAGETVCEASEGGGGAAAVTCTLGTCWPNQCLAIRSCSFSSVERGRLELASSSC
jgi:hypothetical protein